MREKAQPNAGPFSLADHLNTDAQMRARGALMIVKTVRGFEQEFEPTNIALVAAGKFLKKHGHTLFVVGALPMMVHVPKSMDAFVASLPNNGSFVKLIAAKHGNGFWANAARITSIRAATENEQVNMPMAQSVVFFGNIRRFLTNDLAAATALIKSAGGKI